MMLGFLNRYLHTILNIPLQVSRNSIEPDGPSLVRSRCLRLPPAVRTLPPTLEDQCRVYNKYDGEHDPSPHPWHRPCRSVDPSAPAKSQSKRFPAPFTFLQRCQLQLLPRQLQPPIGVPRTMHLGILSVTEHSRASNEITSHEKQLSRCH